MFFLYRRFLHLFSTFFWWKFKTKISVLHSRILELLLKVTPTCYQQPILSFFPFYLFLLFDSFSQILQSIDEARNKIIVIMECMLLFHIVDQIFDSPSQLLFLNVNFYFVNPTIAQKNMLILPSMPTMHGF
jgi:hypothetical protein